MVRDGGPLVRSGRPKAADAGALSTGTAHPVGNTLASTNLVAVLRLLHDLIASFTRLQQRMSEERRDGEINK